MRAVSLLTLFASCAALVGAAPAADAELSSLQSWFCWNPERMEDFSKKEKEAYISAVNCLAKRPHSKLLKASYPRADLPPINENSSFYDDMTYIHMDLTNQIHYTGFFLPWHRWYTNQHVTQLRKQCGYKGVMPYWDWSKDTASFNTSAMWDSDPTSGLGGFGDPNNDYYVNNGGFKDMKVSYPIKRGIRRQYTPYPYLSWWWVPRPKRQPRLYGFPKRDRKAQAFHANVHMIMGGDLAGTCPKAAGSPHAKEDRPGRPATNLFAFKGGSNMTYTDPAFPNGYPPWLSVTDKLPTDGLFPQPTILSTLNTLGSGEYCYIYA
ncbi:Di-copper centre-containing protein [Rhizoctonia solani]|uniref:Di-copper centre-containing protein n=1 Tax=Rhizoctonia solani TaxID=456999 RepID=A0A8H7IN72_9AGAM|nr:Di-copper centre-containing protein [Rhizoctonia solani]